MNEPSVFNGPEVSMPKNALSLAGIEHREWHNLYGIYMHMATAQGLVSRSVTADTTNSNVGLLSGLTGGLTASVSGSDSGLSRDLMPGFAVSSGKASRPFVLTRSFWAGSQKFGAMWTGDNQASWSHLSIAAPMLLSLNLAGFSFVGADVGGFFGEPTPELFTRWYQAGSFTPFFRGHAHHDTKRREPYIYGEPYTGILRAAAVTRYSLLPLWYTAFFEAYETGVPVMRPMFYEYPRLKTGLLLDDQWMVKDVLCVKPVTNSGATRVSVFLPPNDVSASQATWYDFASLKPVTTTSADDFFLRDYPVTLSSIPVFIRTGKIFARKLRVRRSATLMRYDPYTLVIAPPSSSSSTSEGVLFIDDEETFSYLQGNFLARHYLYTTSSTSSTGILQSKQWKDQICSVEMSGTSLCTSSSTTSSYTVENEVERIQLLGQSQSPRTVLLVSSTSSTEGVPLSFSYDATNLVVTVKKPGVKVGDDWQIRFEY
jgi:mannosyl-oligosaccharide alpha-1,3-glucosidase